ncbi:hypothetical protein KJ562_02600 [Patescibacteria group bacterium]|nr:hypothetical protein [Patescibacteria group bacterium]MBU4162359.1 hypothetical protein [Patescibacteria group bacterium]
MFKKNFFSFQNLLNFKINSLALSLVFLLPLFFLPFTASPLFLNKQLFLSIAVFFLFIFWAVKVISFGKFTLDFGKISKAMILFLVVIGISTIFSISRSQSFAVADTPDTFLNILLCGLVYFLSANLFSKREAIEKRGSKDSKESKLPARKFVFGFLASAFVLSIIFLLQAVIRKAIFPLFLTKNFIFNTIGSTEALGIFIGCAFVLLMSLFGNKVIAVKEKADIKSKIIFGLSAITGVIFFASIVLINYWLIWLGVILGIIFVLAQMSKNMGPILTQKEIRQFILPLLILAISLIFVFVRIPTDKIFSYSPEIGLTFKSTVQIGTDTMKISVKNLIIGSGPASFPYQFDLFKPLAINLGAFWQTRFNQGFSVLTTMLSTVGILGVLSVLLLIVTALWQGIRPLFKTKNDDSVEAKLSSVIFTACLYLFFTWFFYPANITLLFLAFLMLGLFVGLEKKGNVKEILFTQSPQKAFGIMMLAVVVMAGAGIGVYKVSQRYAGAVIFADGVNFINSEEPNLENGIKAIVSASNLDQNKDDYLRNLSQAFALQLDELVGNQELSQEDKQKLFQQYISNGESILAEAVRINPKNSENWLQQGSFYQSLEGFGVQGAGQLAFASFQKAYELAPRDPQFPFVLGNMYLVSAKTNSAQIKELENAEEKDQTQIDKLKEAQELLFSQTEEYLLKAIELKRNLVPAFYSLGQFYEFKGDQNLALQAYSIILQLVPEYQDVKARIEALTK